MKKILIISIIYLFLTACAKDPVERGITEEICGVKYVMPCCSPNPSKVIKYYKELGAEVKNQQVETSIILDVVFEKANDVLILKLHYEFHDMGNIGYDMSFEYDPSLRVTKEMKKELIRLIDEQIK